MKLAKTILLLFLGLLIIPIFSIIILSFHSSNGNPFKWYGVILQNENFTTAFILSVLISACTAILNGSLSFILALSWFNKRQLFLVLIMILILGLLPPDILALSISKISQFVGISDSNLFFVMIGLTLYTLPFGVLLFWSRFYFIEAATIATAKDIGIRKFYIVTKVILPLSKATMISCLLLTFLLAFNEYPRTYYLSGSYVLVSEFLNGKLSSGADESIYAGGSITIIITAFSIIILALLSAFFSRRRLSVKAD